MTGILWLVFERPPHPDAVAYPAGEDDVAFVLELLAQPYAERIRLAGQIRRFEREQQQRPTFERRNVACRKPSGLYHLVAWRLAKWLSRVLVADDAVIERTSLQLRRWLKFDREDNSVVGETASGVAQLIT